MPRRSKSTGCTTNRRKAWLMSIFAQKTLLPYAEIISTTLSSDEYLTLQISGLIKSLTLQFGGYGKWVIKRQPSSFLATTSIGDTLKVDIGIFEDYYLLLVYYLCKIWQDVNHCTSAMFEITILLCAYPFIIKCITFKWFVILCLSWGTL